MRAVELPALRRGVEHADLSERSLDSILRAALTESILIDRRANALAARTDAGWRARLPRERASHPSIPFPHLTPFAIGASARTHKNHLLRGSTLE